GEAGCAKTASEIHASLFTAFLSGTHASIEQRIAVARRLINSEDAAGQTLGFAALDAMLEATHFNSHYEFQFGAHSRDYGFYAKTYGELTHWFRTALALAAEITGMQGQRSERAKHIIAANFRGLWSRVGLHDEL